MTTIVVDPAAEAQQTTQDATDQVAESKIPEKYRGKSLEDIVEVLTNVESELGRKNNEVGTLRRLTDQVLSQALQATTARPDNQQTNKRQQLTTEDLLANPEGTVSQLAQEAADKRVAEVDKRTANIEAQLAYSNFQRAHPDFEQTVQSDEFKGWVGSSNYRQRLAYRAAQNDWGAADELMGLYNEHKPAKTETTDKPDPKEAAKAAGLARRGGSSAAGVGTAANGKPILSRQELIAMRINDPEQFERRAEEINLAYKEKRVR